MKTNNTNHHILAAKREQHKLAERKRRKENRFSHTQEETISQNKQLAHQRGAVNKFLDDLQIKHD
jgi:hypothetical protein